MNDVPLDVPVASSTSPQSARSGAQTWPTRSGTVRAGRGAPARLGQAKLRALRGRLSDRDWSVLRTLGELRLATSSQLEVLHFSDAATQLTAARKSRRTLRRLTEVGLLRRLDRLIGGLHAGSAAYIYTLTAAGQRLLAEPGARRKSHEPSLPFVDHTLAISELYVQLHQRRRGSEPVELLTIETEPRCWRRYSGLSGEQHVLRPDLYLACRVGPDELRWFIEVDLGSEHRPALLRKARAYQHYYESGVEQQREGLFPRVAWLVPDAQRASELARALNRDHELTGELFAVLLLDQAAEQLTR